MSHTRSLFRKEALNNKAERLYGDIHIFLPMSWHLISYGAIAFLVLISLFLSVANYSKVAHVRGHITLDKGIAKIIAIQKGIVASVLVQDGQKVKKGQRLANILSGLYLQDNKTAPHKMLQSLKQQDGQFAAQIRSLRRSEQAQKLEIQAQISGLTHGMKQLLSQISIQKRLIHYANQNYLRISKLAKQALVSQQDLESSATIFASRQQTLAQLEERLADKRSSIMSHQRQILFFHASILAQIADIKAKQAQLEQQIAQIQSEQGYSLIAPFSGIVTGVTAKVGQPTSQEPLMLVVPQGAHIEAELEVPTELAGFIEVGQSTRLLVDAFPYEHFGTVAAKVSYISTATSSKTNVSGLRVPVYIATVSIASPWIKAFGQNQPLVPGMALNARILTQKQTLLEWLFEPLFAVTKR